MMAEGRLSLADQLHRLERMIERVVEKGDRCH
jgi:hypothetical protein